MRNLKKVLSFFLALAMIFGMAMPVSAAEETKALADKTIILHSNDVHGKIEGYAYMAQLKKSYESMGAEVILVDAGDYSQGTTYVSLSKGASAVELMNEVGYNFAILGNHEFDYGYEQLKKNLSKAEFKVLCANVTDASGKTIYDANATYVTKSGVKIGFFGLETPEASTKANPSLIKGLDFHLTDTFDVAKKQVEALKDADIKICIAHLGVDASSMGNTSYDLYKNVEGLDFIIDGHSHTVMTKGKNGEPIQSTGTAFDNIGIIVIDNASKKIVRNTLYKLYEESAKNKRVAKSAQAIIDAVKAEYGAKFATSEVALNGEKAPNGNRDSETNNGDIIADSMLWAILKNEGSLTVDSDHVVAITNGGGVRAAINVGDITKNDVFTVLPFGNTIAVIYVKGSELLEALEASTFAVPEAIGGFPQIAGMKITLDTTKAYDASETPYGASTYFGPKSIKRVTINEVGGKAFDPDATYAVVTSNFLAAGGDTYYVFSNSTSQYDTGITMDEALMDFISNKLGGVIGKEYAEPQGRITIVK